MRHLLILILFLFSILSFADSFSRGDSKKIYKALSLGVDPICLEEICKLELTSAACQSIDYGRMGSKVFSCIFVRGVENDITTITEDAKKVYRKLSSVIEPVCEEVVLGMQICILMVDNVKCLKEKRDYNCSLEVN